MFSELNNMISSGLMTCWAILVFPADWLVKIGLESMKENHAFTVIECMSIFLILKVWVELLRGNVERG